MLYFIVPNNCVHFNEYSLLFTSQTQFDIFYVKINFPSELNISLKIYIFKNSFLKKNAFNILGKLNFQEFVAFINR